MDCLTFFIVIECSESSEGRSASRHQVTSCCLATSLTKSAGCPSGLLPLFQNEPWRETIQMKINLICMKMNVRVKIIFI